MRLFIKERSIRVGGWRGVHGGLTLRWLLSGLILVVGMGHVRAQTVSFNFSSTSSAWPGWVNVAGDPSQGVQTATANGVTISSVATANWSPWSGVAAGTGNGFYPGSYFPARVMASNWFTYNGTGRNLALYNVLTPQIELSGLNPDSSYVLQISGSDGGSFVSSPTEYTVTGKTNYGTQSLNAHNNAANGVVFAGVTPDATGMIRLYVNATTSTDIAVISGIQIYPGYYGVGSPGVTITAPANGANLAEGNNVVIKSIVAEVTNTISKVEFYADTTKIGEVDTVPYNFTWTDPDPGVYTITAKATDNLGTVNSAAVSVDVAALNTYWSTTGNVGNNADSTFIGNVDSVRLDLRTKNIQRMSISATGNVGIGTISPTARLHATGSARLAGLVNDSLSVYPRALVSDSSGNVAYRSAAGLGQAVGAGLGETGTGVLMLGDSIAGPGAHSFSANRYQYLGGYLYSIGGKANDPVNAADFRWYNNGDIASGTTMDRSVNTQNQTGWRYYNKIGTMEIGASDRLDTMRSKWITGNWQGSGLVITTDDSNRGGPKMINSIYMADLNHVDTTVMMLNSLLAMEASTISYPGSLTNTIISGIGQYVGAPLSNSVMVGDGCAVNYPANAIFLGGYQNGSMDTSQYTTVGGSDNQFGGLGQLVGGVFLKNRTPFGTAFGCTNVDFTTLPYTGTRGMTVAGISGYPLLSIGNSSTSAFSSNAVTVLYNGRTQVNTTGYSAGLTQTAVTPKAALEVVSTNSGVLFPKLNTGQRVAIATSDLQDGLLFYNTDSGSFQYFNGAAWGEVTKVGSPNSGGWGSFGNTGINPAANFLGATDSTNLVFRTDDTARITISGSGAVGIGTASPQAGSLLAVDGSLYATKVEVTLAGWPDYVFDKGYALPGLPTVGRYIARYRHLPGMPSSAEVAAKGIDLGDNQAVLLKKVEELTLYMIDEHKRTMARQQEIDQLKVQEKSLDDHQREIDELKEMLEKLDAKNKNELHK